MGNILRCARGPQDAACSRPRRFVFHGAGRALVTLVAAAALAVVTGACTRARAETTPEGPPLATPAPPPRMLAPVEAVVAEAPPPPEEPIEAPPEAPAERQPPQRRPQPPDTAKAPEPAPAAAPPVVAEAPVVRQPTANPAEEKKILEILQRFNRDINRVDYKNLQPTGKEQYNQAKRFEELARQEIVNRNYPLAATHADKAATIATELLRQ